MQEYIICTVNIVVSVLLISLLCALYFSLCQIILRLFRMSRSISKSPHINIFMTLHHKHFYHPFPKQFYIWPWCRIYTANKCVFIFSIMNFYDYTLQNIIIIWLLMLCQSLVIDDTVLVLPWIRTTTTRSTLELKEANCPTSVNLDERNGVCYHLQLLHPQLFATLQRHSLLLGLL